MVTQQQEAVARPEWEELPEAGMADDPLLDCLVALTRFHERPISAEALCAGLPLEDGQLTPELFPRAAARAGLAARNLKRPLRKLHNLVLPAVLLLRGRQACVLLEIDTRRKRAKALFPDSGAGAEEVSLKDLGERYLGYAIFVKPEYRFDNRAPEPLSLRSRHWFWGTLLSSWRIYRDVLVASLLINSFALATPLFVMNVYDRVVPNNAVETLWVLTIGVAVVYLFDLLMRGLRGYFIDVAGKKADLVLSSMIMERVLGLKLAARPVSVGGFSNNLREFDSIRDFIASATMTTLVDVPFVLLFLLVISAIGGPVVLAPAIGIPVVLVYGLIVQVPLRGAVDKSLRMATQRNATLVETLTGLEAVKTLGAEGVLQRKWEQAVGYISKWSVRSRLLSASALNVAVLAQQLATIGTVVLGVYLVGDGELSLGGLIACVILTGRAMAPMAQVANLTTRYYQARAALQTLNDIMQLPQERSPERSYVHRPNLEGGIEFQNVTFAYPGQMLPALNGVSFTVQPGERVAIIGRIGSGKTTVEKLVMGLYEPAEGSVLVDGIDLRQIDPADLRRNVGYVPQDTMLFFGTVRDNITLGAPAVGDAAILRAAALAGVNEFTDRHPLGLDMPVGERGEGLSGGQRQTIAIARAWLLDPTVMVMDEPTNSMDNTTESVIKTKLAESMDDKTLLLVTHRASLLELVDRIIVLDGGRKVADGPKAQVLEALKQGRLRTAQARGG